MKWTGRRSSSLPFLPKTSGRLEVACCLAWDPPLASSCSGGPAAPGSQLPTHVELSPQASLWFHGRVWRVQTLSSPWPPSSGRSRAPESLQNSFHRGPASRLSWIACYTRSPALKRKSLELVLPLMSNVSLWFVTSTDIKCIFLDGQFFERATNFMWNTDVGLEDRNQVGHQPDVQGV